MTQRSRFIANAFRKSWSQLMIAICCLSTIFWAACSPGTIEFPDNDRTFITLVPDGSTVNVGEQLQFTVQLTKKGVTTNADPALFNWISSGPSVATVDDHGRALGIAPGNVTIQAQSKSQPGNAGGASLNVQIAPPVATLAAMPEAVLVRFAATQREVSYALIGARHFLRTKITFGDGSVSQREQFVPEISNGGWLALDSSGASLYVLSRTSRRVLVFAVDPLSGELAARPSHIRVDADVFAIAVEQEGTIKLRHLSGRESQIQVQPRK